MILGFDTETTGLETHHGAKPFFVTTCNEESEQQYWEWDVDPFTRQPLIPKGDLNEIRRLLRNARKIVMHHGKFDVRIMETVWKFIWPWYKTHDTLLTSHLVNSGEFLNLTAQALKWLGIDIEDREDAIRDATKEARQMARRNDFKEKHGVWRIANKGLPEMPGAKNETWKYDMWLPRAVAKAEGYPKSHPWWTVCSEYANPDSFSCLNIFLRQFEEIEKRNLTSIYEYRRLLLEVVYRMENNGIVVSEERMEELVARFDEEIDKAGSICTQVSKNYRHELVLGKGKVNNSVMDLCFSKDKLNLPVLCRTETGKPSLKGPVIEAYLDTLKPNTDQHAFVSALKARTARCTAKGYLDSYKRFWLPHTDGYYILYAGFNPTGTHTLRWTSSNPNVQQISKKEEANVRYVFGPGPDEEWWSLDAKNIELRLPAYEAGEKEMIALFERPDEPPYFGSNHLLVFDILHPDKWNRKDPEGLLKAKKKYASSWYQWVKNGNFAVQYGAMIESGTADRAYHMPGAQERIQARFKNIARLNQRCIAFAQKHGYIETMADKFVDPERGYPLECEFRWGKVRPTVPLNYRIQGTAMWWMAGAMIRCQDYLDRLNEDAGVDPNYGTPVFKMVMQIHDELVFSFPKGSGKYPWRTNLPKIRKIKSLMERGGEGLGIPTPVSCEYHANNWSVGVSV